MKDAELSPDAYRRVMPSDPLLNEAYFQAAEHNVLAAVNHDVFHGYFSVTAGAGHFGSDTTFPGLDWGQSLEALLWLGQQATALASWAYVRSFVREDGLVPFCINPSEAGRTLKIHGHYDLRVEDNGAVFDHWCPGNPFRALGNVTLLQVARAIVRHTDDRQWLADQLPVIRRVVDWILSLLTEEHLVRGAGFYLERPMRIEYDGIAQCYVADALRRTAELYRLLDLPAEQIAPLLRTAESIEAAFREHFWLDDHFADYVHPTRGPIGFHGLTDVDWAAIATGAASREQIDVLWPQLRRNRDFYYGEMPTGIATDPLAFESWEWGQLDRHDLAAMGRVWYLEAWARSRMGDRDGIIDSLRRVARRGKDHDWCWMERYYSPRTGPLAAAPVDIRYVEYPANFIRIVHQFV